MKCYAESLGNCAKKMSREHIISQKLLPARVGISGFTWCNQEEVFVGKNSFTIKNLCKKHNSDLSPYDSEMKRFFLCLDKCLTLKGSIYRVSGPQVERWILKTIVNLVHYYSGIERVEIDYDSVLPFLFQERQFTYPYGLMIAHSNFIKASFKDKLMFNIDSSTENGHRMLNTGFLIYHGFPFILRLNTKANRKRESYYRALGSGKLITKNGMQYIWHPRSFNGPKGSKVELSWKDELDE